MRQNTDLHQDRCFLEDKNIIPPTNEPALFFIMDFKHLEVKVNCSKNWRNMNINGGALSNEHSKLTEELNFQFVINEISSRNPKEIQQRIVRVQHRKS